MEEVASPPPPTLAEPVGPPPAGVAPLDQFRAALLRLDETWGRPPSPYYLKHTNTKLLRYFRHEQADGAHEVRIRMMVDHGGWSEADDAVVKLGSPS